MTDGIRQNLNHVSDRDRLTPRDHDLTKPVGRKSALHQLEIVRPEHALFYTPFFWFQITTTLQWMTKRQREIHCLFVQPLYSKTAIPWRAHVIVECRFDPCTPECLRVITDALWRARIDLRMHGVVQPQTHLPIHRSIVAYTSSRSVFEALDQRCTGHSGLPHAALTAETVRHVSCLPNQLVDLSVKT